MAPRVVRNTISLVPASPPSKASCCGTSSGADQEGQKTACQIKEDNKQRRRSICNLPAEWTYSGSKFAVVDKGLVLVEKA